MKCPVSMLPGLGGSLTGVLFVIGIIATVSYAIKAGNQPASKQ